MALLYGELATWPTMYGMAALLRSAGLVVTVGRYSVRIEGHSHFVFQQYGGDLGDPVIDADDECVSKLLATASLVSTALARTGYVHRFEIYEDSDELAGYLHFEWPLPVSGSVS